MTSPRTVRGDIFHSEAQVLVNPVNCAGVMGAGLAKQFRDRYPEMFAQYREDCRKGLVRTGNVRLYQPGKPGDPIVANLPTKKHWRNPSRMKYVREGLRDLVLKLRAEGIRTVALPALGAGLGGLDQREVLEAMREILAAPGLEAEIRLPDGGEKEPGGAAPER